ncbi:MAG: hypothetical protein IKB62_04820 [Oscillospiraceae bacterium]|nr:hypothetical protein [Oscillospiraceae bacterium]
MEQLIGDIIQHIIQIITPFIRKLTKHLILTILLLLYLVAFWFLFFTRGIYVEGHFYRKEANLTTVTYTCRNPFAQHKTITLQKQANRSVITVGSDYVLTVDSDKGVSVEGDMGVNQTLPDARWDMIADQSAECNRGFGGKLWVLTLLLMAGAFFINRYSTKVYNFFNRNKAANDNYYLWVGRISKAIYVLGLIYLIIPL